MIEELKPCPKCGPDGAPLRCIGEMYEYKVECVECHTVQTPCFKTLKEAEAYWNAFAEGMTQQAARIAELEKMAEARKLANRLLEQERNELEAERDQLQEALQKIAEMEAGSHEPSFEMRGCMTSESCMNCDEMIDIAREALRGTKNE